VFNSQYWPDVWILISRGFVLTIVLSIAVVIGSSVIGVTLGLSSHYGRMSTKKYSLSNTLVTVFVRIFRSVPPLVLLFLLYFGIPSAFDIQFDALPAAILGISLFYGAYMIEVVRSGLESVPVGEVEACKALGLNRGQSLRFVIFPQGIRLSLPAGTGLWIGAAKDTALATGIGLFELTTAMMTVRQITLSSWNVFGVAAVLYFGLNFGFSRLGSGLERLLGEDRRIARAQGEKASRGREFAKSRKGST